MTRGRWVATFLHISGKAPGVRLFTKGHAALYRRSRGRRMRRWFGAPVLVLDVRGRTTGRLQTVPLIYLQVPEGYVVTGANAGAERTPQWCRNLLAAGEAVVHVGGRTEPVTARVAEGAERDELWARLVEAQPAIGEYHRYTDRVFPVVVLQPRLTLQ